MSPYVKNLRKYVGTDLLLLPAAAAIIWDDRGRVLLIHRGDNGAWSLPGGMVEPGETVADGLVREVQEETGLLVRPVRLVGVYSDPAQTRLTYPNGDQAHFVSSTFECQVEGGTKQPDGEESLAVEYFDPGELPDSVFSGHRIRIQDALTRRPEAFFR